MYPSIPFSTYVTLILSVNTLRPRQNGRHFADATFKRIFLNENIRILIKISPKFIPKVPINNIPAFVQIMAWHRPGHYLNQWWFLYWRIYASLCLNELKVKWFNIFHYYRNNHSPKSLTTMTNTAVPDWHDGPMYNFVTNNSAINETIKCLLTPKQDTAKEHYCSHGKNF